MIRSIVSLSDLAATCRGRRRALRLSQTELANRAGVSRQWISEFESGKATAEVGLVVTLLEALDLRLSVSDGSSADAPRVDGTAPVDLDALLVENHTR